MSTLVRLAGAVLLSSLVHASDALALSAPNPPQLSVDKSGRHLLVRFIQNSPDAQWYAAEHLGTVGVDIKLPVWSEIGRVEAIKGATGRRLEIVGMAGDAPGPDRPGVYRVCTAKALRQGEWGPPPTMDGTYTQGKECSVAVRYPALAGMEQVSAETRSAMPSALQSLPGVKERTAAIGAPMAAASASKHLRAVPRYVAPNPPSPSPSLLPPAGSAMPAQGLTR